MSISAKMTSGVVYAKMTSGVVYGHMSTNYPRGLFLQVLQGSAHKC